MVCEYYNDSMSFIYGDNYGLCTLYWVFSFGLLYVSISFLVVGCGVFIMMYSKSAQFPLFS